jgi:ABC-type dipeptide/oligopeptide/nickel transport system permease component
MSQISAKHFHNIPFKLIGSYLGWAVLTFWGATILIWALVLLEPDDPAARLLQAQGVSNPHPDELASMRQDLGLDRPLPVQYVQWLGRTFQGDFSYSYQSGQPVRSEFGRRLPATLLLAGAGLVISLLVALPAGLLGALYQTYWPDHVARLLAQFGTHIPLFLVGLAFLNVSLTLESEFGWPRTGLGDQAGQVWLPALCLALGISAQWAQQTRSRLLAALGSYATLLARTRLTVRLSVLCRYALPKVYLSLLVMIGAGSGYCLGAVPIIERIFDWPGLGGYIVVAIGEGDLPVIQASLLIGVSLYVGLRLLVRTFEGVIIERKW